MTKFAVGADTHVGQVRQVNQDNILRADDVFAVADGMGGHRGGEVASLVAVEALQASFTERTTDALVDAVQQANEAIVVRANGDPDLRGMGTTMCALASVHLETGEEILTVVNVGDSRAYLLKAGDRDLVQISEDHSLVQTLVRQGQLTPAEAAVHPQRNILTRALGIDQKVLPDSFDLLPVKGDRYLLCSDGLFNEVEEPRIAEVLVEYKDPQEASEVLVRLANEGGGRDNISVVVVDVLDDAGRTLRMEDESDDPRVVHVVHGTERVGRPPEDEPPVATPTAPPGPPPAAGAVEPPPTGPWAESSTAAPATGGFMSATMQAAPAAADGVPVPSPLAPPLTVASPRSRFTWRVGLFLVVLVGIFAVGAFAVHWVGTSSYFVGVDNGEVVVFQGRPGGFLWYQPVVQDRTALEATAVPVEFQADVRAGKIEPSLDEAHAYVARLLEASAAVTPPSATTTTTSPSSPSTSTTAPASIGGAVGPAAESTVRPSPTP